MSFQRALLVLSVCLVVVYHRSEACIRLNGAGVVFDINVVKVNMKTDLMSKCVSSIIPSDIWRCLNQTCEGRANITHMTFSSCEAPVEVPLLPLVGDSIRIACFCTGITKAKSCGELDNICPGFLNTSPEAAGVRACPV